MPIYDIDMDTISKNSSQWMIINQIMPGSLVLECGCATGYMTKYMREKLGAKVYIIEFEKESFEKARQYAEDGACADLNNSRWTENFIGTKFDYIIFADVLEHLNNPAKTLKQAVTLLKDDGSVLISLPNIAHNDIIFRLLNDEWNYTAEGLIDQTHIRFFSLNNLDALCDEAGLTIVEQNYTTYPFQTTEQKIMRKTIPALQDYFLRFHQNGEIYQFIITAKIKKYVEKYGIKRNILSPPPSGFLNTLYYAGEDGQFSEDKSIRGCLGFDEKYEGSFDLSGLGASALRFDPVEGLSCVIWDLEVIADGQVCSTIPINGTYLKDYIFFDTNDPQILIELPKGVVGAVTITAGILPLEQAHLLALMRAYKFAYSQSEDNMRNIKLLAEAESRAAEAESRAVKAEIRAAEAESRIAEANTHIEQCEKSVAEAEARAAEAEARVAEAEERVAEAEARVAEAEARVAEANTHIEQCEKSVAEAEARAVETNTHIEQCEKSMAEAEARATEAEARIEMANARTASAQDQLQIILNSQIWRITAPVRKLLDFLKKNYMFAAFYNMMRRIKQRTSILTESAPIDYLKLEKHNIAEASNLQEVKYKGSIDVIIPVYNGYEYLDELFISVEKTAMKYRMIIIDDKSPDERILPKLKEYAALHHNVTLLENKINLGFVKSVNRALELSSGHVALLNTDIVLPENWLERLMAPIISNKNVASSTPFTNSGTICSFPEFIKDNALFAGLSPEEIDSGFKKIVPWYTRMPTGVGFCMGMNRNTLNEIGVFDADTFGLGYSEENDWCQRAIDKGYVNVLVENLFVYHKHGGSFSPETKEAQLKKNIALLIQKHPDYARQVEVYCKADPVKELREYIKVKLLESLNGTHTVLAFNHTWGGGSVAYLDKKIVEETKKGNRFVTAIYCSQSGYYEINYYFGGDSASCRLDSLDEIICQLPERIDEIWINGLVSFPNMYGTLKKITTLAEVRKIPMRMLLHDYFALCPTINLLNDETCYCSVPSLDECRRCMKNNKMVYYEEDGQKMEMGEWRKNWGKFLLSCDEVIAFSEDSKKILKMAYSDIHNVIVIPHAIKPLVHVCKMPKTSTTLNIGLLGVLSIQKGLEVVKQMVRIVESEKLDIRIKLIGYSNEIIGSSVFSQTGPYSVEALPNLVADLDIDVFFIASIWPETFSYTTEEIMTMDMPIAAFDLGAPAERVRKYKKGLIISKVDAGCVISELLKFAESGFIVPQM